MNVAPLSRTLDQELLALMRGASLECLVCGEFVLRRPHAIACPECGAAFALKEAEPRLHWNAQAG